MSYTNIKARKVFELQYTFYLLHLLQKLVKHKETSSFAYLCLDVCACVWMYVWWYVWYHVRIFRRTIVKHIMQKNFFIFNELIQGWYENIWSTSRCKRIALWYPPHSTFSSSRKEITPLFLSLLIFRSACYYWRWQYIGNVYKCCARIVSDDRCEDWMLNLYRTPFSAMCFLLLLKNWRWFHETAYWSLIDQICLRSSSYSFFYISHVIFR